MSYLQRVVCNLYVRMVARAQRVHRIVITACHVFFMRACHSGSCTASLMSVAMCTVLRVSAGIVHEWRCVHSMVCKWRNVHSAMSGGVCAVPCVSAVVHSIVRKQRHVYSAVCKR